MNAPARRFEAKQATLAEVPMLIGIIGPPGGGKTWSALRLAAGMRKVRPGPIVLIDTERGRASKYAASFDFLRVDFQPPFKPVDFLQAIKEQLPLNPAAVIVDSLSDEHEGEGGVLDWHDQDVGRVGGNEWAAWSKPKASRRTLINGILQIKTPLIFTFRAREKTKQMPNDRGKNVPVNIGWQPIAPLEIVHALDLTAILPPRADGVPVWKSDKVGEDFIIKLPRYLQPYIKEGQPLSEDMGEAFARWAAGGQPSPRSPEPHSHAADRAAPSSTGSSQGPTSGAAGGPSQIPSADEYCDRWDAMLEEAAPEQAAELTKLWNGQKQQRNLIDWPDDGMFDRLKGRVLAKLQALKEPQQ